MRESTANLLMGAQVPCLLQRLADLQWPTKWANGTMNELWEAGTGLWGALFLEGPIGH